MAIYTVHPAFSGKRPAPHDDVALAAESFSWAAFLFGPFWLLAHRLWLWLLVWLLAVVAFFALANFLAGSVSGATLLSVAVMAQALLGLEANDLRRQSLERAGRPAVDVVVARSSNAAAGRFFRRRAGLAPEGDPDSGSGSDRSRPAPAPAKGFLTLFPDERAP